jgi:hypothetical protein
MMMTLMEAMSLKPLYLQINNIEESDVVLFVISLYRSISMVPSTSRVKRLENQQTKQSK